MRFSLPIFILIVLAVLIVAAERVVVRNMTPESPPLISLPQIAPAAGLEASDVYSEADTPQPMGPPEPKPEEKGVSLSTTAFGPPGSLAYVPEHTQQPKIVIIIDDMGMDLAHSREMIDLPAPLTLSFLPYAPDVRRMVAEGKAKGHELMIHMPMEPVDAGQDMGPIALREGMSARDFDAMLDKAFGSFSGYVGMNNHMGSRLTQDSAAMARLMQALKKRGLLFVDSKTIPQSVAAREAEKAGVPYAVRDVFLDDDSTKQAVLDELKETERVARRAGLAVVIGHPKEATVEALREWLPGVGRKGFALAPVSEAVSGNLHEAQKN